MSNNITSTAFNNARYKSFAWKILLSFGFTYLFFYNGRQNINLVMSMMADEFGSSTAALGVVSSALFWCYAFGQLINGRLGAFIGYKKIMLIGVIGSAISNIAISFIPSNSSFIPLIAVIWGINGFFQSTVWANGLGVVNKWWPKSKRGFSTGLTTAFTGLAQVVTYLTVWLCLKLNPTWGWKAAFRFPILPMLVILIAFIIWFKEKPEDVGLATIKEDDADEEKHQAELEENIKIKGYLYPYKVLFREPKLIIFCVVSAFAGIGRYGLITWIPTYFDEALNIPIKNGIFSAILLPIGHACAMFLFPYLSDKVFNGKREPIIIIASIITFCGMICFPFIKEQWPASIMLFIVGVSSMVTGVIWAIAGDIGGKIFSSTVVGILDWAAYMGAAIQAAAFGFAKDAFGWPAIFITIGVLYVAILVLTLIASKMKTKYV